MMNGSWKMTLGCWQMLVSVGVDFDALTGHLFSKFRERNRGQLLQSQGLRKLQA